MGGPDRCPSKVHKKAGGQKNPHSGAEGTKKDSGKQVSRKETFKEKPDSYKFKEDVRKGCLKMSKKGPGKPRWSSNGQS